MFGGKDLGLGEQPHVVGSLRAIIVRADEARLQRQAAPSPTGFTQHRHTLTHITCASGRAGDPTVCHCDLPSKT